MSDSAYAVRILVADDDWSVRELLLRFLGASGYQVEVCADGRAALALAGSKSFALLLVDHQMPGLTGLDVVEVLRASGQDLPVILMSGSLTREVLNRCEGLDPIASIAKPIELGTIRKLVDNLILRED